MKFLEAKEYQSGCESKYQYYKSKVQELLPEARVEHIGSSSILDAVSKGDLDILVCVDKPKLESAIEVLKQLHFFEKQNTLRTDELCMLESFDRDIAFQVVAKGPQFDLFILFRDKLRSTPSLVSRYNQLKRGCEGMTQPEYRKIKSAFIVEVLAIA